MLLAKLLKVKIVPESETPPLSSASLEVPGMSADKLKAEALGAEKNSSQPANAAAKKDPFLDLLAWAGLPQ